jgi:ATP-dependent Clp protease adaptor protein ClpS
MFNSLGTVLDPKKSKAKYPEARVIVLDDNFNTFQHVANCLLTIIPSMSKKREWDLPSKLTRQDLQRYGEVILNRQSYIMSNYLAKD